MTLGHAFPGVVSIASWDALRVRSTAMFGAFGRTALRHHVDLVGSDCSEPEMAAAFIEDAVDFIGADIVMPHAAPNVAGMPNDASGRWRRSGRALPGDVMGKHVTVPVVRRRRQDAVPLRLRPAGPEAAVTINEQTIPDRRVAPTATTASVEVATVCMEAAFANTDLIGVSHEVGAAHLADARDGTLRGHLDLLSRGATPRAVCSGAWVSCRPNYTSHQEVCYAN
jgi:hypothetical protein